MSVWCLPENLWILHIYIYIYIVYIYIYSWSWHMWMHPGHVKYIRALPCLCTEFCQVSCIIFVSIGKLVRGWCGCHPSNVFGGAFGCDCLCVKGVFSSVKILEHRKFGSMLSEQNTSQSTSCSYVPPKLNIWRFPEMVVPPNESYIWVEFSIVNHPCWVTTIYGKSRSSLEAVERPLGVQAMEVHGAGKGCPKISKVFQNVWFRIISFAIMFIYYIISIYIYIYTSIYLSIYIYICIDRNLWISCVYIYILNRKNKQYYICILELVFGNSWASSLPCPGDRSLHVRCQSSFGPLWC